MPLPRVIVTRPAREAAHWVDQLSAHGLDAVALPLIGIGPCTDPAAQQALAQARARLAGYRALMFVSGNAATYFLHQNSPYRWIGRRYQLSKQEHGHPARAQRPRWCRRACHPARSTARRPMPRSSTPNRCGNRCTARSEPVTVCSSCAGARPRPTARTNRCRARGATGSHSRSLPPAGRWTLWWHTNAAHPLSMRRRGRWRNRPRRTARCGC